MQTRKAALDGYGFVPTEYHSLGGSGPTMIRRTSRGWVASLWMGGGRGYEPVTGPCESFEACLAAYDEWVHRPADNQQEF